MTNGWVDIKNTDMMLIMGGNPAENHPCGFKWAIEAKRNRNAKMIVVDPRFTRTASVADLFCQIRAGADIAFLGGVIRYAIENNRIAKDYLLNYTNAAFIVKDGFKLPEADGVFSGFDAKSQTYEKSSWNYAGGDASGKPVPEVHATVAHPSNGVPPPAPALPEKVAYDFSLQNPNCVFQLLKKHYSRYTPEMVERITGIPKDQFEKAADLFTSVRKNGDMKKAATIIYAVGWTHHTFGTQIIRTAAMLQLLLGNVGRAGGGVNALRGHSNIQGATDMAGIFDNLPGYLKVPTPADISFEAWAKRVTPKPAKPGKWDSFNYWGNTPGFAEKDGTFTNSARWLQWKNAALPMPGDCRLDQAIVAQIFLKVRELYKKDPGKFPDPVLKLTWNYTDPSNPSLAEVLKEINGKTFVDAEDPATKVQLKAGQQVPGFAWLKDDGTTACGNWIYCGSYTEAGNLTARRDAGDPSGLGMHHTWAWSWPATRRVLYNRASCDGDGKPWDPTRRQVWWNESTQKWVGNDVPDFKVDSKPKDHMGPFIMNPEGVGRIFAPLGAFADGPFPEFYEPIESPIDNPLHPQQTHNPVVKRLKSPDDKYGTPKDGYTVVCTTYPLTDHSHYWTKNNPMNVQLVPEPFVEIPEEMAAEMGLRGGETLKISSIRGSYIAKAMVTKRIKQMTIDGKKTYQIGIPIHWGYRGIAEDEGKTAKTLTNQLSPTVVDPNAYTPEFKGFLVKVEKA